VALNGVTAGRCGAEAEKPSRQAGLVPLGALLSGSGPLATLCNRAEQLSKVQNLLSQTWPAWFGSTCQAVALEAQTLTVFVTQAAMAARLRQMGPGVCRALQQAGFDCTMLEVRVRPAFPGAPAPVSPARSVGHLDQEGRNALEALAQRLPEGSPLREAVEKLAHMPVRPS
jgi:hypothetical protein